MLMRFLPGWNEETFNHNTENVYIAMERTGYVLFRALVLNIVHNVSVHIAFELALMRDFIP